MRGLTFRILIAAMLCGFSASAGTLRLGSPTVEANQYVFPVILHGADTPVAAMDFRLQFDPAVFRPVSADPGTMALQSDKTVTANAPAPGEYVVVMMGFNQNGVEGGEVARIALERIGADAQGSSRVAVTDTTFSTWEGQEVASEGSERLVDLGGDEAPVDPDEPEEPDQEPPTEEIPGGAPVDTPETPAPPKTGARTSGPMFTETAAPDNGAAPGPGRNELARAFQDAAIARAQLESVRGSGEEQTTGDTAGELGQDGSPSGPRVESGGELASTASADTDIIKIESAKEEGVPRATGAAAALANRGEGMATYWLTALAALAFIVLALLLLRNRFFA